MKTLLAAMAFTCLALTATAEPLVLPLWPDGPPMSKGTGEGHDPTLTVYLPDEATGVGVVVCPGGGYGNLAVDHEGQQIAEWLNEAGIAAFVLRYRHAPDYGHPVPLMDAQRAVRTVRANAGDWKVDPARIGMIGFSAGGHLTATAATQPQGGDLGAADPIEWASAALNFAILGYPVITMTDPYTHKGSRKNLLGENPDDDMITRMSAEKNVDEETPPIFIVHTTEDQSVPVQNALMLYEACVQHGVPAELHVYEKGRHGLGLGGGDPAFATWPDRCLDWLRARAILK